MPRRDWADDGELLLDLGDALRVDPVERQVIAAGLAIGAFRAADPIAALVFDSTVDGVAAVRGPGPGGPRNLTFSLGEVRVEIEIGDAGIEGQLIPPEPGPVRLLTADGAVADTEADEVGCFAFPGAGRHGPIRIECAAGGRRVATEWISL
jgi:hypothetical protein